MLWLVDGVRGCGVGSCVVKVDRSGWDIVINWVCWFVRGCGRLKRKGLGLLFAGWVVKRVGR